MRRLLAAGLLVVLWAPLAAADPPQPPSPVPTPTAVGPEDPLQITVSQLLPRAPTANDAFLVQGVLKNTGTTTVRSIQVRLRVGDRVQTRGALHEADTDRPLTQSRSRTATAPTSTTLAPGASTPFRILTTVRVLGLTGLGVYPLDVEARGDAGDGFHPLGLAPTWVPYFGPVRPQRTRVAVVWPLVDQPHQNTQDALVDDSLADTLAPTGRLGRLLSAGEAAATRQCDPVVHLPTPPGATPAPVVTAPAARCDPTPVTYAIDPDLLEAASTMSAPYHVVGDAPGTPAHPGTGQAVARSWLTLLRQSVGKSAVLALPYADPDVTALARPTGGTFRDDLSLAEVLGRTVTTGLLGVQPVDTVAWPPAGVVTPAAADVLSRGGARALVLDPSAYEQPDAEPSPTPSARTQLPSNAGTPLEGLVADDYLSRLVSGPSAATLGPRLAEQRFLAETAIIAAQEPSVSRTLVIAPDRRGDVSSAAAIGALRDLGRVPWLCPVTLSSVAADAERCPGGPDIATPAAQDRGALRTSSAGEVPASFLAGVGTDRNQAVQLTDAVLTDNAQGPVAAMKARLRRAIARAESSAWRTNPEGGQVATSWLHDEVQRLLGKIVVRGGQVLLTSSRGTLQVSVENTLDVPVTVRVRFRPRTLGLVTAQSRLVEVAPGHAVPVSVRATAQKSGQFVVDAQLVDRNGHDLGQPSSVYVRSTRYGRLALAVTIGGAGVLFVGAGFRVIRRALRRTAPAPTP